jgi:hypothetical protein
VEIKAEDDWNLFQRLNYYGKEYQNNITKIKTLEAFIVDL